MVVGIDPHKNTHTAVAVSAVTGAKIGEITVSARNRGHERLLTWARGLGEECVFAVEDCRHVSGGLQRFLLARGEPMVPVPPKLMAGARRGARTRGKSDPIDAAAVAQAALRHPELPAAHLAGAERDVRLLVDHRDDLVGERTRIQNRLRWNLHDLDPSFAVPPRGLDRFVWLERIRAHLRGFEPSTQLRIAAEQTDAIEVLTRTIKALEREITTLVQLLAPELLQIVGCGPLTGAKLFGEAGGVRRFRSEAAFAMHAGTSPLEVASGDRQRHRLNRSGNRQLNAALHRIAVTQRRIHPVAQVFLDRKRSDGLGSREALRCLKRYLARTVYKTLRSIEPRKDAQMALTITDTALAASA
jgi:transposase